jgi:putative flippase GtrA
MFLQFIKFCVVGGTGVVVDFGITFLFKEKLKLNKYIANSLGFMAAASTNYLLNRWWTFRSHDPDVAQQYVQFVGISAIGLILNNIIIYLLNDKARLNFYLSKLIAIGLVTLWNFFMNYYFTFTGK